MLNVADVVCSQAVDVRVVAPPNCRVFVVVNSEMRRYYMTAKVVLLSFVAFAALQPPMETLILAGVYLAVHKAGLKLLHSEVVIIQVGTLDAEQEFVDTMGKQLANWLSA